MIKSFLYVHASVCVWLSFREKCGQNKWWNQHQTLLCQLIICSAPDAVAGWTPLLRTLLRALALWKLAGPLNNTTTKGEERGNTDTSDRAWWQLFRCPLANYNRAWQVPKTICEQTACELLRVAVCFWIQIKIARPMSCQTIIVFCFCQALLPSLMTLQLVRWSYSGCFTICLMPNIIEPGGMESEKTVIDIKCSIFCHILTTNYRCFSILCDRPAEFVNNWKVAIKW